MTKQLHDVRVAILVEDAFEQVEMTQPRNILEEAGAKTVLVSPHTPSVQGWNHHTPSERFDVDVPLEEARVDDFDALVLPGGVMNPDTLRMQRAAVQFVRGFADAGKPIAAICHGPWMLVEAGISRGRKLTSWPSLQTDIRNSGGTWVDQSVVEDDRLVTSRKPDDLAEFGEAMIRVFSKARRSAPGEHGTVASSRSSSIV
jgi:protease I